MTVTRAIACVLCAVLGAASARAAEVVIMPEGDERRVQTPRYEARIGRDGCFTSLKVAGMEFFTTSESGPRGAYFYQDALIPLPEVTQPDDHTVVATSEKASARYQFAPDRLTWTLTNATAKAMVFVIVFDPAVKAGMDDTGRFEQAPALLGWKLSTWFRGRANVRLTGSTRLWPWNGQHQVWEVGLGPKETRTVTLEIGTATDEEIAQAAEVAQAPPPPPPTDPVGPMWDLKALSKPPRVYPAEEFVEEGVQALFFEGVPYRGKPTRVFAWLGLPRVAPGQKVPGMVLVHGGGGTAFAEWVRLWTGRGYAAIALDTCGCVPKGTYGNWERHPHGGPPGWGGFDQLDWPREDQWTYHAVADAILAHSLLRSLPEVDPQRIGVTGISWGGYLTCIIAGVDPRFRLAVPVYGCGYTLDMAFASAVTSQGEERARRWMRWWDPSVYLADAAMPMLWVTGSNDFAYTLNALQQSYRQPKGSRTLCIRLRMPHGHGGPGENPEEIRVFADSILRDGEPLPTITAQGREGERVWATYQSQRRVVKAELNVTKDLGAWQERHWEALPAQLEANGRVTATLPAGVTVYYLNLYDDRDCVVSTEHVELAR